MADPDHAGPEDPRPLIAIGGIVLAAVVLPAALCAVLLAAIWLVTGWPRRRLLAPFGVGAALVVIAGVGDAAGRFLSAAPAWRSQSAIADLGLGEWVLRVAPGALVLGSLVALMAVSIVRWLRPPWIAERTPGPTLRERQTRRQARRDLQAGERVDGATVALGTDEASGEIVGLTWEQLVRHTLLIGATGFGKTTTLVQIARELARDQVGVVIVDLKGDPGLVEDMRRLAGRYGRAFAHFDLNGTGEPWNPLAIGNPTELMDKLVGLDEWTESYFKRGAQRYLQLALRAMQASGEHVDIAAVMKRLRPDSLGALVDQNDKIPEDLAEHVRAYLAEDVADDKGVLSAVNGLRSRLGVLAESDMGPQLAASEDGIDLFDAMAGGHVVVFSLNSMQYPEAAAHIGSLVINDLKTVVGRRTAARAAGDTDESRVLVAVDEFASLGDAKIAALFPDGAVLWNRAAARHPRDRRPPSDRRALRRSRVRQLRRQHHPPAVRRRNRRVPRQRPRHRDGLRADLPGRRQPARLSRDRARVSQAHRDGLRPPGRAVHPASQPDQDARQRRGLRRHQAPHQRAAPHPHPPRRHPPQPGRFASKPASPAGRKVSKQASQQANEAEGVTVDEPSALTLQHAALVEAAASTDTTEHADGAS